MSYFFLAKTDDADYAVSREYAYIWGVYEGVSAEFTYLWGILEGIQTEFTYIWKVIVWGVSKQYTYRWNIRAYVDRQFTYIWNLYATVSSIGSKVKYSFKAGAVKNRFYRMFRDG